MTDLITIKIEDPYDITQDDEIIKEEKKTVKVKRSVSAAQKASDLPLDESFSQKSGADEGEYACSTCPRSFRSLAGRQRHMSKCSVIVENSDNVKHCPCCTEDIDTCHREGEFPCEECDGKFLTADNLERHVITVHREIETFGCNDCPARFLDKVTLIVHLERHSDVKENSLKPFMCTVCHTLFTRKYHLARHALQTGCGGAKISAHDCQVCGRVFTRKDNLREHLRAHAGINKRLTWYKCEYCHLDVAGLTNFNNHRKEHVGDRPYKCRYCDKYFPTSGAQKKHIRTHTGEKPYQCKECRRQFGAKETLNRHVKIHTRERPFKCNHCGKGFIQGSQLRAHMFHHTGENGFTCSQCGESFNRKNKLQIHIKYEHEHADPLHCDTCDKSFLRKEDLMKHALTHAIEKAFECPTCHKRFAQKAYLKTHSLTHTKEPPRACNYCNRAFIRQDCLLRHMRARHRDKLHEILIGAERKKLQLQLLAMSKQQPSNNHSAGKQNDSQNDSPKDEEALVEKLSSELAALLDILVDEDTLRSLGASQAPLVEVLKQVIIRCGHTPVSDPLMSTLDCIRENAKLLFTFIIDDAAVKSLLNNQPIDDVIYNVLQLVKS